MDGSIMIYLYAALDFFGIATLLIVAKTYFFPSKIEESQETVELETPVDHLCRNIESDIYSVTLEPHKAPEMKGMSSICSSTTDAEDAVRYAMAFSGPSYGSSPGDFEELESAPTETPKKKKTKKTKPKKTTKKNTKTKKKTRTKS